MVIVSVDDSTLLLDQWWKWFVWSEGRHSAAVWCCSSFLRCALWSFALTF